MINQQPDCRSNIINLEKSSQITWEELISTISQFPDRFVNKLVLNRSIKIQNDYINYIEKVGGKENVNKLVDKELYETELLFLDNIRMKITGNKFPYNVCKDILHMLVWTESNISEIIDTFTKINLIEFYDYIIFNNSPQIRSIKRNHYHLFILQHNLEYIFAQSVSCS